MQETTGKVIKEEGKMNLFTDNRLLYEGRASGFSEEEIRQSLGVGGNSGQAGRTGQTGRTSQIGRTI